MKNYVQPGDMLTVPAPEDVTSGSVVVIGSIIGVAAGDADAGDSLDIATRGVFNLPKVSALAISIGDKVYFDPTAKLVTETATGNTLLGVAASVAVNPSGTVNVRLNGAF